MRNAAIGPRRFAAALLAGGLLTGCSTLSYYEQSVRGHFGMMAQRRPIEVVIGDPATGRTVQSKLAYAAEARRFAAQTAGLSDHGSYRTYADLKRDYVVWNVFATPELSLEPVNWCFPLVGCLTYRGYFLEHDAEALAATLRERGDDVFVGGVAAYSTLGLFDDPILNTMLRWNNERLARVIFHELAHQKLYIAGDTAFNESFAEFVAEALWRRWLAERGSPEMIETSCRAGERDLEFRDMLLAARERLQDIFTSSTPPEEQRARKAAVFSALQDEYGEFKKRWSDYSGYDEYMSRDLNNAKLAAIATYYEYAPAFAALYREYGMDFQSFYAHADQLAKLSSEARQACLLDLAASPAAAEQPCGVTSLRVAGPDGPSSDQQRPAAPGSPLHSDAAAPSFKAVSHAADNLTQVRTPSCPSFTD